MVGRTRHKQQINLLELSKEELTKEEIERIEEGIKQAELEFLKKCSQHLLRKRVGAFIMQKIKGGIEK